MEWHGWARSDDLREKGEALHIGPLPGRKSVCLYVIKGSVLTPLAYFRNEEAAERALALLDRLVDR